MQAQCVHRLARATRRLPRGCAAHAAAATKPITKDTPLEDIPTPENLAPLFEPIKLGPFDLMTRAVYAPLTRCRAMGAVTQPEAAIYYSQRANRGQLMLTEATGVTESHTGYGYPNTPGLYSEEQTEAWKPVVKAVHDKGAVFFAQIWHTGRASHELYEPDGKQPVSSSDIAITSDQVFHPTTFEQLPYSKPRPLTTEEVGEFVEAFRKGARNARAAGFDGVELHATNGYLVNQFLDDGVNKRTDKYGGSIENRCRFCLEIIQSLTEEIGSDRVGIRLGPFTGFLDSVISDPYECYTYLVEQLNGFNLAYMHFIEPRVQGNTDKETVTDTLEPFLEKCKTVKLLAGGFIDHSGKINHGPDAIRAGHGDMIVYGRWALANPDFLKRLKLGAPLNKYDRATFYVPGNKGYIDYPFLHETDYGSKFFSE